MNRLGSYVCPVCEQVTYDPMGHVDDCPGSIETMMRAEAEMETRMVLPAAGYHCDFHPEAPAVKRLITSGGHKLDLCAACCENVAEELISGLKADPGQAQWEAERE